MLLITQNKLSRKCLKCKEKTYNVFFFFKIFLFQKHGKNYVQYNLKGKQGFL